MTSSITTERWILIPANGSGFEFTVCPFMNLLVRLGIHAFVSRPASSQTNLNPVLGSGWECTSVHLKAGNVDGFWRHALLVTL